MEKLMMTWIFSSLLTAYMSVLFMVSIVNIKISKKQWIILILSLSLCHTIFRNIIPQLFFPFLFIIMYSSLIYTIVLNVKLIKTLKFSILFFVFLLITEVIIVVLLNIFLDVDLSKVSFGIKEYILALPVYFVQIYLVILMKKYIKKKE